MTFRWSNLANIDRLDGFFEQQNFFLLINKIDYSVSIKHNTWKILEVLAIGSA
jgi:hypothetical protein